jgi:TonB family protein
MQSGHPGLRRTGRDRRDRRIDRRIRVKRGLDERLDREAVKALGQWRFRPGQKDGQDVRVRISIEMTFSAR